MTTKRASAAANQQPSDCCIQEMNEKCFKLIPGGRRRRQFQILLFHFGSRQKEKKEKKNFQKINQNSFVVFSLVSVNESTCFIFHFNSR